MYVSEENYYHYPNFNELRVNTGRFYGPRPRRRFRPGFGFFPIVPFYPWWFYTRPYPRWWF